MNLIPFYYGTDPIRTFTENDELWFVAKDVCDILELGNITNAMIRLDEDEKLTLKLLTSGQQRETWVINESGLYHLILTSTKPEAKAFRKWVTGTVLPAIRKAGKYTPEQLQTKELEIQQLITEIENTEMCISDYQSTIKTWKQQNDIRNLKLRNLLRTDSSQLALPFTE